MDEKFMMMREKAIEVMGKAYAPYSKFHVGACLITDKGSYFSGCNCENASYGLTQCAEASAIGAMVSAGQRVIRAIWIVGSGESVCTPCGACRQRILEFATPQTVVYMSSQSGKTKCVNFNELMPMPFDLQSD